MKCNNVEHCPCKSALNILSIISVPYSSDAFCDLDHTILLSELLDRGYTSMRTLTRKFYIRKLRPFN